MNPIHWLHLYEKPKLGNRLLRRLVAYSYRHKISAIGGFDTASCDVAIPPNEAQEFLDQYIGNRVAVFVDNPTEAVWEGFINRLSFSAGGYSFTIGLDEMMNRVQTIYTSSGAPTQSPAVNDTESQAVYGIKAGRIEMGVQGSAGATTALRDTVLNQRAWPKTSVRPGGGSGLVTVEMLGFWHTLAWENWNDTTSATTQATTLINTILLPGIANDNTFFDNTDTSQIATNTTTILRTRTRGQTMQEVLREIAETGDASNYWVVGVTPTIPETGKRRLYYRVFNSAVEYTARLSDGLRVRNKYGAIVPPYEVRPDKGIRIADILPGWDGKGNDPRETWIGSVDYDGNRQSVQWASDDNVTAEGVFQLHQYNRAHGRSFGAQRRVN